MVFATLVLNACSNQAKQVHCESVGQENFDSLGNLTVCYMTGLTVIEASDYEISTAREQTVRGLRLNGNKKISFLPLEAYKKFPNLIGYYAYECSIKMLKKENFLNLDKLKHIILFKNQIEMIYSDTFEGLSSLERIDLGKVRGEIFLHKLIFLSLSTDKNKISQMNGDLFEGLNNLVVVDLEKNPCINLHFKDPKKMETLSRVVTERCGFDEDVCSI